MPQRSASTNSRPAAVILLAAALLWLAGARLLAPDRPRIARSIIGPIIETIAKPVEDHAFAIR